MNQTLLRLLRIAPLALLFAGVAIAQTTGTIIGVVTDASSGKPVAGAVVVARSPALQGEQTAVTDDNGAYRVTLLPPGEYVLAVQLEGYKPAERSDITLRTDKTIRANMAVVPEAVQMEEQVVRTGAAPVVNIGAAESGAVVSREFVANVPVGRTYEQVAAVVPQASADLYGIGFAGAQSPENAYILDGLNVTDPVYGTLGGNPIVQTATPQLLTSFVQEIDVKTGGFNAEYGRTTGGVMNVVTRSGSNEFHGSVFGNFNPRFLIQPAGTVTGDAGEAVGFRDKPDEGAYDLDLGFEVGGPIQKDRLWFYAGFAPVVTAKRHERFLRQNILDGNAEDPLGFGRAVDSSGNFRYTRIPGTSDIVESGRTTYQVTGKLTYLLDENNNFTVSGFALPSNITQYTSLMKAYDQRRTWDTDDNTLDFIGRYSGKFLDKRLIVEATGGWHRNTSVDQPNTFLRDTPSIRWDDYLNVTDFERGSLLDQGYCVDDPATPDVDEGTALCPVHQYRTGGLSYINDTEANRLAFRTSASYLIEALGSHNAKAGVDVERSTYSIVKQYSGGYDFRADGGTFFVRRGFGFLTSPGAISTKDPQFVNPTTTSATDSTTTSTSLYLQDSWQLPVANVTLNAGLRWEGQKMENTTNPNDNGFSINNSWAPRVQAIWDFTGNGRGKVAGNYGRFFYALPLDIGDRLFGNEREIRWAVAEESCPSWTGATARGGRAAFDPRTLNYPGSPAAQQCATPVAVSASTGNFFAQSGSIETPVDPGIDAAYVDQFGGQVEYEILSDLSVGLEYNGRRQGNVIEDMSPDDGETYFVGNPSRGSPFTAPDGTPIDPTTVSSVDLMTQRTLPNSFPTPDRSYDGLTFSVRKNFSQNWQAAASYTYSVLRGNYAGPYRPEDGQLDPGLTAEFDIPSILANHTGLLPSDRTHQVKLFGSYTFNFGPRFNVTTGGSYIGESGTPVSALGGYNAIYDTSQTFVIPRGMGGRTPFAHRIDLRGALEYVITPPYAVRFSVDLFNVFNTEEILAIDEDYTFDFVQPIQGIKCSSRNAAGSSNPVRKLQQNCPDLAYLKTMDGRPVTVNPNWGRAAPGTQTGGSAYQVPFSMRFGVALSF
jgi:hypothetical protein